MRRTLMTLMVAAAVLSAHGADDICSDVETCVTESGSKCDRTEKNCPPCLYKPRSSSKYMCYELNLFNSCDFGLTYCAPKSESSSGDGSDTPEPTTVKPTKKPTKKPTVKPSNETSSSGSGSDAVKPATKTPKPTTKAPTVAPTTPVPTPDTNATLSSQETASPSSAESSNAKSSGSKMPMFIGIGAAAVVVVAVVAFFIWKKNRDDDDDDSDDDEYRFKQAPKTLPATRAAAPTPSVATTASYNNSSGSRPPSSPGKYGGGGYGKGYGNGGNQYQHYASGNTYAYGNGHDDFGSPSTIDGSQRGMHTGRGGMAYDSHDNSNDSRDVWGNAAPAKQSRPVPTVKTTQPAYREKRTLSNVSVEF